MLEAYWRMAKAAFKGGRNQGQSLATDNRGLGLRTAIMLPIAVAIGALVAGIIIPIGIDEVANANTSNYSSGADTLWSNLDLFVVLAVLGLFVGYMMDAF